MGVVIPEDLSDRLRRLEQFRAQATRTARRITRNYDDAQDAVQEALLKVALVPEIDWDRAGSLLSATTRNVCIDTIRSNTRRARRDAVYFRDDYSVPDQGDEICEQMAARWLEGNLDRLNPMEQQILRLSMEGVELSEIASRVGLSYKGAHSALSRAKRRMTGYWQAALACGVALGISTRSRRAAVSAALAASVSATALLVPGIWRTELHLADTGIARVNDSAASRADVAVRLPSLPARPLTRSLAEVTPTVQPHHTVVRALRSQHVVNPLLPIRVSRADVTESLLETTLACIKDRLVLSINLIGCTPGEEIADPRPHSKG